MRDVSVTFRANSGSIQVVRGTTDDTGTATAALGTGGNPANRDITVTATGGSITAQTVVNVRGTIITIDGLSTTTIGQTVELTVTLLDSSGTNGIPGKIITMSSALGNRMVDYNGTNYVTDSNGKITCSVTVDSAGSGTDTITASAVSATGSHTLSISTEDIFAFVTPLHTQELLLWDPANIPNTCHQVQLNWTDISLQPKVGQSVRFSSTRGDLYSDANCLSSLDGQVNIVDTDLEGNSTAYISSANSGPAEISAVAVSGPSTQIEIEFVASAASSLILQADPALIGVNTPGDFNKQSNLIATVRDPNNNLVKNKVIDFTIIADPTGGSLTGSPAITNSYGIASAIYRAGTVPSGTDGVEIEAVVQEAPVINDTALITVAQEALFLTIGTGNDISAPDTVSYSMPWEVRVTDAAGGPVAGAKVTLNLRSDAYYKGIWAEDDPFTTWFQQVSAGPCVNEDLNQNGIFELGEDINGNGLLDPGNIASVVPDDAFVDPTSSSTVITNEAGRATFSIQYSQNYANWVEVTLTLRTKTAGSEWQSSESFILPILSSDVAVENILPPGVFSPFGTANTCTNPN